MRCLNLRDAEVHYQPGFLDPVSADEALVQLTSEIAWEQPTVTLFGKRHPIPRLCAWYGEPDSHYTWAGVRQTPRPWTPTLAALRSRLRDRGLQFDAVLVNLYRDGLDHMGWHADDEPELGPTIASVSLGATRTFRMKHRDPSHPAVAIELEHGSLLTMQGTTQSHWKHALPKRKRVQSPRLNLTFREITRPGNAVLR